MQKIMGQNWFIWLASLIPGLGIALLGKRKLGLGVGLGICVLFAIFWFVPHMVTWFIFGIAFIAQMAYAVALATIRTTKSEVTLNSNLAHPLPARFSDPKQIAAEVKKALTPLLSSGERLTTAIIGLQTGTSQYMLVGVTQEHLIIATCSPAGNPTDVQYIEKADVTWVSLLMGMRNLFFEIKYAEDKVLTLHVSGKLRTQAKLIVDEYPGTWSEDTSQFDISSLQKEQLRPNTIIVGVICIVLVFAVLFLSIGLKKTDQLIVVELAFSAGLFVFVWPYFINFVRRLKKDPVITSTNMVASIYMLGVIIAWIYALNTAGGNIIFLIGK
jgi:hypothetical protein